MSVSLLTPDQQRLAAVKARVAERLEELMDRRVCPECGAMHNSRCVTCGRRAGAIAELEPLARMLGIE